MTSRPSIRADILGKLLLIQETLDVLPDSAGIAEFLRRALSEIPGVVDVHLYVGGKVFPPSREFEEIGARCEAAWKTSGACPDDTVGAARVICLPLRTARRLYGMLILSLDDEEAFSPYRAFVRNLDNIVATTFETRDHIRQLDEARAGLETMVAERTATLKESQEKFRALVETTSDWVWEVDAGGIYTYASPRVEALLGFKPEEVIGKTPFDFMPPQERQRIASVFLEASRAAKPLEQVLNTNLHKDGHEVVMETSGTPILDAVGKVAGYRGIDRDVTARQRGQQALRESENKFRQMSANAPDAIIVLDQDGKIADWNAAAEKTFGYEAAEVIGRDLHSLLVPARQQGAFREGLLQFRDTGTGPVINKALEAAALRRDGTEFPVELSISSVPLRGEWHAIGIVRDISERKRAEEALGKVASDLKEAQRLAGIGSWDWETATDTITWSEEYYHIFGIDPAQRPPGYEDHLRVYTPESAARLDAAVKRNLQTGESYELDLEFASTEGPRRWITTRSESKRDAHGRITGLRGTAEDITERKLAEEVLRTSEQRLDLALESGQMGVWDLDLIHDSAWRTVQHDRIFGYDSLLPEWGQAIFLRHVVAEDRDRVRQCFEEAFRTDRLAFECQIAPSDQDRRWILARGRVYRDENARPVRMLGTVMDITERKRAEEALRESRARLELALQSARMGAWHWDIVENRRHFDAQVCRLMGIDAATFTGTAEEFFGAVHPDDVETLKAALARTVQQDVPYEPEYRAVWPDGSVHYITARGRLVRDDKGRAERIDGIIWDVTERKRVERELRESEQRLRVHVDQTPLGVIEWDTDFRVVRWNPSAARTFGYTAAEAMGRHASFIVAADAREAVDDVWSHLMVGQGGKRNTNRNMTKDGRVILCEWYNTPLILSDGKVVGVASLVEDVTERKWAEQALRESEETLKMVSSSAQDAILMLDNDGSIALWNAAAEKMFGYSSEEALGKDLLRLLIPARFQEAHRTAFPRFRSTGQGAVVGRTTELAALRRDGTEFAIELSLAAVKLRDKWCAVGFVRDITERQRLQAEFLQSQKLESVGRLAGGVAHDFNNMLTAILGYAELTLLRLGAGHAVAPLIEEIVKAGQRSASLTRQLLAFARKETIAPKVLDLNDAVEGILKMLRRVIGENMTLVWTPGSAPWNVKADAAQIDQVLANLAVNARDAMTGRDARLEIDTSNVVLNADFIKSHPEAAQGEFVLLRVADNGCGMDAHTLANVFEPFFTTKPSGQGTGLGMSTVYGIVKQHNGFIDIESALGMGTTVHLYFPRTAEMAESTEAGPEPVMRRGAETILLVDDEESVRAPVAEMLRHLGYQVLVASGGAEAATFAESHVGKIDLLLTDVIMPGMNGVQLRQKLVERLPDVKALFMSGYAGDVISTLGVLDAGISFIQKPITMRLLDDAVRKSLDEAIDNLKEPAVSAG